MNVMQFVIITGMSGSGKSSAVNVLEDIGYYCVDNMPPELIPKFANICSQSDGKIDKVAFVVDIRGGDLFLKLQDTVKQLQGEGVSLKILFLDSSDDVIVRRYKETRQLMFDFSDDDTESIVEEENTGEVKTSEDTSLSLFQED